MTDLPDRLEAAAEWSTHQASPTPDWDGLLKEAAAALRALEGHLRRLLACSGGLDHPHEEVVDPLHTCSCEKRGYDAALRAMSQGRTA